MHAKKMHLTKGLSEKTTRARIKNTKSKLVFVLL